MTVPKTLIFDMPASISLVKARKALLDRLLPVLRQQVELKTALDVGCGIGYFSAYLNEAGFEVTAFDARRENIEEARIRYPELKFHVSDVENTSGRDAGQFDLVLCFGLLYHLENPFIAIRNLHSMTGKIMLVESMCISNDEAALYLYDEGRSEDQGMNFTAFYPTERSIIKMLYRSGFNFVYQLTALPAHPDFNDTLLRKKARNIFLASRVRLTEPLLRPVQEPRTVFRPAQTMWGKALRPLVRLGNFLRKSNRGKLRTVSRFFRHIWISVFPWMPMPVRLPSGAWFIARNDAMGRHVWLRDNFEEQEQKFLANFLKSGMVFLDIGAHNGLYALLASKKVGPSGRVFAFEPSSREFNRLRRNLSINRCRNVRIEPSAVGRTEGTSELYVCNGPETGLNSMRVPLISQPVTKRPVMVTTLDGYFRDKDPGRIDFIKLDVEGGELDVLKGAARVLANFRPIIMCELSDIRTLAWGYPSVDIYDFLKGFKYGLFSVTAEGRLRRCPRRERFDENLFAVPEERLEAAGSNIAGEVDADA